MEEILKKIDEMKAEAERIMVKVPCDSLDEIANDISSGYIAACNDLKDFINDKQKESSECEILHNQLMETEKELLKSRRERDFWRNESMKWCDKSFEYRVKLEGGK